MKYAISLLILVLAFSTFAFKPATGEEQILQQETLIGVIDEQRKEEPKAEPKGEKEWEDLTREEKIELNPNNCDYSKQYIWESDGSCHAKETQQVKLTTSEVTGSKQQWLEASGIPQSQWSYVDYIVTRESGWNPNAVNASSGACGLGQQLPCGKWAGAWNDPVAALKAMNIYVNARYGGWAGAINFWNANHWY